MIKRLMKSTWRVILSERKLVRSKADNPIELVKSTINIPIVGAADSDEMLRIVSQLALDMRDRLFGRLLGPGWLQGGSKEVQLGQ